MTSIRNIEFQHHNHADNYRQRLQASQQLQGIGDGARDDVAERMQDTVDAVGHIQKARRAAEDMREMGLEHETATGAAPSAPPGVVQPAALPQPAVPLLGHRGPGSMPATKPKAMLLQIDSPEGREPRGRPPAPAPAVQNAQSVPPQWSWAGGAPTEQPHVRTVAF